jgi:hypothetical protein
MFGSILNLNNTLNADNQYVFTFTLGTWLFPPSEDSVKQQVQIDISNIAWVSKVNRPLFSDRYEIVIIPSDNLTLEQWLNVFDSVFKDMGYPDYTFVSAEGGSESSSPGGIEEILSDVGGVVGDTTASTAKAILTPLIPYIVIGGIIYLGILTLPTLLMKRR